MADGGHAGWHVAGVLDVGCGLERQADPKSSTKMRTRAKRLAMIGMERTDLLLLSLPSRILFMCILSGRAAYIDWACRIKCYLLQAPLCKSAPCPRWPLAQTLKVRPDDGIIKVGGVDSDFGKLGTSLNPGTQESGGPPLWSIKNNQPGRFMDISLVDVRVLGQSFGATLIARKPGQETSN